ncbi:hypothetical protein [Nostoc sp.]|uniref:hypothetical protein n=1 Tax=Nostoc sp. TaxID=1180 RepID=UPI002FFAEE78
MGIGDWGLGIGEMRKQGAGEAGEAGGEKLLKLITQSPIPHAQCPMPHAQCPMPHAQCSMPNAQCPMPNE